MVLAGQGETGQGIEIKQDMKSLEEYISGNAAAFDAGLPPEGAEERFLGRWEAGRRRVRIFLTALPAAAAAALAVLLLLPPAGRSRDWLRAAGDTPEGIYAGYMAQVTMAWEKAGIDEGRSEQLRNLTEETIPLVDLLPDELSDAEKTVILKEHYNTILDGVHQILTMAE